MDVENNFFEFEFDEEGLATAVVMRNEADEITGRGERDGG
jgi:hypothetical protein